MSDDVIQQAARVIAAVDQKYDLGSGDLPTTTEHAQALAAAGLLARPLPTRDQIERAVGSIVWNASNYPEPVQHLMLGQDIAPLRNKITNAVLALLNRGPDMSVRTV